MTFLHQMAWAMSSTAQVNAFFITVFYWSLLYGGNNSYWNTFAHALNSIVVLLDLGTAAKPWRLEHVYWPVCFGLWYLIFSLVYYGAGGLDPDGNVLPSHHFPLPLLDR